MRRIVVSILFAAGLFTSNTYGATRLVNGASGCSDTTGNPYCTINKAILAAADGDTIQIAAGTYAGAIANFSKPLTFIGAGSGSSGTEITKSITYTGTGPLAFSNLRIVGGGSNLKVGGTGNFSGLTVAGVAFVGNGNGAHGLFIKQNGSVSNVSVTNCTFTNHGQSGMLIQKGTGPVTAIDAVSVTGSTFAGNGEYGLRVDPRVTNLALSHSSITNNNIDGFLLLNADGVLLDTVTITGNRNGILLIPLAVTESISNVTLTNVNASANARFMSGQYGSGMTLSGGTGSISAITATGSAFSSNAIHGVAVSGVVSQVSISCSVIAQNVQHGVSNASSPAAEVKAEHVYWGCAGGPGTAGCSTVNGSVDTSPYRSVSNGSCTAPVLTSIAVTPSPVSVAHHATTQLTATATYADGTTGDVTSSATWTSGASAIASVAAGLVTGESPGTATIAATIGTISGNASATVTAVATSLAVSPATLEVEAGETASLTATLTWSDGTTSDVTATAAWSSSDAAVAPVSAGTVTAVAGGTATLTAVASGVSGTALITVPEDVATLTAIAIEPAAATLLAGETLQLTARGTYSDGSTAVVTASAAWSVTPSSARPSAAPTVASTSPPTAARRSHSTSSATATCPSSGRCRSPGTAMRSFPTWP